jgi:hypothetical protein
MHDQLLADIDGMFVELAGHQYEGRQDDVLGIVDRCRHELLGQSPRVGPWETELLRLAEEAARANRLYLALHYAKDALEVSQLPADEYGIGFNYSRR